MPLPQPRLPAIRALAIAVCLIGLAVAFAGLVLIWTTGRFPYPEYLYDTASNVCTVLVLAIALLIAWRAGDTLANVSMSLALSFVVISNALSILLIGLGHVDDALAQIVDGLSFYVGAVCFIRATQLFPRPLSAADVAASPIWGRFKPLRASLTFLLHPWVIWVGVACVAAGSFFSTNKQIDEALRLTILLLGLVFFHLSFRSGDAESRRKVLWLFEAVLASVVMSAVVLGLRATLGNSITPDMRVAINLTLVSLDSVVPLVCVAAAVFYVGAFSPALVLRKTLVYGATASLLLFLFAAVEIYIVEHVVESLGVESHLASAFLGATFGLAFHPLKHRLERGLQRVAPHEKAAD